MRLPQLCCLHEPEAEANLGQQGRRHGPGWGIGGRPSSVSAWAAALRPVCILTAGSAASPFTSRTLEAGRAAAHSKGGVGEAEAGSGRTSAGPALLLPVCSDGGDDDDGSNSCVDDGPPTPAWPALLPRAAKTALLRKLWPGPAQGTARALRGAAGAAGAAGVTHGGAGSCPRPGAGAPLNRGRPGLRSTPHPPSNPELSDELRRARRGWGPTVPTPSPLPPLPAPPTTSHRSNTNPQHLLHSRLGKVRGAWLPTAPWVCGGRGTGQEGHAALLSLPWSPRLGDAGCRGCASVGLAGQPAASFGGCVACGPSPAHPAQRGGFPRRSGKSGGPPSELTAIQRATPSCGRSGVGKAAAVRGACVSSLRPPGLSRERARACEVAHGGSRGAPHPRRSAVHTPATQDGPRLPGGTPSRTQPGRGPGLGGPKLGSGAAVQVTRASPCPGLSVLW
ncbi:collagen alpha-1(I) chain-like [Oryctolagus cuniculus]|uniref:collagen alpha-1(I) chain-like n=1 Tax=Oryctolagus cuniculus TaxID=9986 RepID=UPI00387A797D